MIKLSEIISLPVINLFDLKTVGTVENVYINPTTKKISLLKIYNEDSDEYSVLDFKDIYCLGEHAVLIKNSTKLTLLENKELLIEKLACPLNSNCYNLKGTALGKTSEANFENNVLHSLEVNNISYPAQNIIGMSNTLTIISEEKVKIKSFKPKTKFYLPKKIASSKVKIESTTPQKDNSYDFLLKRKLTKDIKNDNGEIIAKIGSTITTNLLNKLKCYGKLKELTLNSK